MTTNRAIVRCLRLSLTGTLSALLLAAPARADEAANTATARALGTEGVTLADNGRCAEAIEKLERAERLHHAPTTATRLGECEIEMGRLIVGTERLQRVVREPLPPNAHPAFAAAVQRAQRSLEKALPRIATLRLSVKAPAGVKFTVAIDDDAVPDAMLDSNRRIDPGVHKILVTAPGFLPSSASISLDEGQTKGAALELQPDPNAPVDAQAPVDHPDSPRADGPASARRGSKVPAIIAFGAGALGIGVGAFAGLEVGQKSSSLSSACDVNKVCPTSSRSDIRDAKTWSTVSTVGFIAGGVGIVSGVMLLLTSGSTPRTPQTGLRVRPSVGPASVGLDGEF